jgi:S1-C subfamily serine protease
VVSIEEGGPADIAGISLGDVVIACERKPASDPADLLGALTGDRIGSPVTLRILRGGAPSDIAVIVGERQRRTED